MKHKRFILFLGALAVGSALFALFALMADSGQLLVSALCFPFAQIGAGLRALSLSGTAGNLAAWAVYLAIAAIPLLVWLMLRRKGRAVPADGLLALLTPVLLLVLYKMVNPYGWLLADSAAMQSIYKAQYGGTVYVMLVGWAVLRILRQFRSADSPTLYRWLSRFVMALATVFVMAAFGGCFGELLTTMEEVRAGNTDGGSLTLTYLFVTLRALVEALPWLMDTVAALLALDLLDAMAADSDSQAAAANALAAWSKITLVVTTVLGVGYHVLQMLCMDGLRNVSASLVLPVGSVAFLLICMAAARIVAENKALREENDLYI